MTVQLSRLFEPIQLGPFTIKNRIALSSHNVRFKFYGDDEQPDQYIDYLRARAKGGCGFIKMWAIHVHRASAGLGMIVPPDPEKLLPKCRRLADAVHEHGTRIVLQLHHRGVEFDSRENRVPLYGFSQKPSPSSQEVCKEMEERDIQEILDSYALYSQVARDSGLDGIEIHATHGYLIQQSWSPWANWRTDRWGERMAFANAVIGRVRAELGDNLLLGLRISSDDFWPGADGLDNEAMQDIAREIEGTGKVNYIALSAGSYLRHYSLSIPSMYFPPAVWVPLASGIKQALERTPLIVGGGINDPVLADKILEEGHADLVTMTRAQICDPEMGNKARAGRLEEIRTCIRCNQGCADKLFDRMSVTCLQNAAVGRERELSEIKRSPTTKKVVVVGGGPGGMEAARVAATRGHKVILYEKEQQLGGSVNLLVKVPSREEFGGLTRNLTKAIARLGVDVRLGVTVDEKLIQREAPDAVIIATGSKPFVSPLPGSDQDNVVTVHDVLEGEKPVGKWVGIVDTTGWQEAYTLAELLADSGKEVEVVTPFPVAGQYVGFTQVPLVNERLLSRGVSLVTNTKVKAIAGRTLIVSHVYCEEDRVIGDFDTIVLATGYRSNDALYRVLRGKVKELYAVGDCVAPRRVLDAIHEGFNTSFVL